MPVYWLFDSRLNPVGTGSTLPKMHSAITSMNIFRQLIGDNNPFDEIDGGIDEVAGGTCHAKILDFESLDGIILSSSSSDEWITTKRNLSHPYL